MNYLFQEVLTTPCMLTCHSITWCEHQEHSLLWGSLVFLPAEQLTALWGRTQENTTWKERDGSENETQTQLPRERTKPRVWSWSPAGSTGQRVPAGSYLCTGSGGWGWWAAACPPWLRGRGSGRSRAPCTPPSPTRRASAGGSRSAGGWCPEPLWCKAMSMGYLAKITALISPRSHFILHLFYVSTAMLCFTIGERSDGYSGRILDLSPAVFPLFSFLCIIS